jgi:hypothetical protein
VKFMAAEASPSAYHHRSLATFAALRSREIGMASPRRSPRRSKGAKCCKYKSVVVWSGSSTITDSELSTLKSQFSETRLIDDASIDRMLCR